MSTKKNTNSFIHKHKSKDKQFQRQTTKVFRAFSERPKTMLMVSIETGILRANICRYVAEWKKENRIGIARKGLCKISKHRAGYYTTDPSLFIHSNTGSHE